jgi:hypothetical protein
MRFTDCDDARLPPKVAELSEGKRRAFVDIYNGARDAGLSDQDALSKAFLAAGRQQMVRCAIQRKAQLEVIKRNDDGSGVVRIPILKVGNLDLSDGGAPVAVTRQMLREAVANFRDYPGPVPIGVSPHRKFMERSGPSPGFVEALTVKGDDLVADLWLVAELFSEVDRGYWRGFSVEFFEDGLPLPSKRMEGAVLVGGVFTNRPAAHVNFAPSFEKAAEVLAVSLEIGPASGSSKERTMSKTAEELQAELDAREETIRQLETQAKEARSSKGDLDDRLKTANKELAQTKAKLATLEAEKTEAEEKAAETRARLEGQEKKQKDLEEQIAKLTKSETSREVKLVIEEAIDQGVAPAVFDGYEKDPAAWLDGSYKTLENLKAVIATLPKENPHGKHCAPASSKSSDPSAADVGLRKEAVDTLKGLGLNPAYAKADNENQFRELQARFGGSKQRQAEA